MDPDPGEPKTCGSGFRSRTLLFEGIFILVFIHIKSQKEVTE
jgi:hypothetical protein